MQSGGNGEKIRGDGAQVCGECVSPKRRKVEACAVGEEEQKPGEIDKRRDPAEVFGADFFQVKILSLVDALSLARTMLVSRRWLALARADALWQPFCPRLWEGRAHLPLQLLHSPQVPRRIAYAMTLADLRQVDITPREACARTWTIKLKPTCGSYWTLLDPTHKGQPPLRRYFLCDGSLEADPRDPIWGGQESTWRIIYPKADDKSQHVRINKWPLFKVNRTENGGWFFENKFAIYSTVPDFDTVKSFKDRKWRCSSCGRGDAGSSSDSLPP